MFEPVRGGTRGGQAEFKWSDVSADKDRENYLGHSINAPTGRWQKNKDIHWYNREIKQTDAERQEELRLIREQEAEALAAALGFAPGQKPGASSGPGTGANAVGVTPKPDEPADAEKEEKRRRKEERKREKEEKRARKDARRAERHARKHTPGDDDRDDYSSRNMHGTQSRSPRRKSRDEERGQYRRDSGSRSRSPPPRRPVMDYSERERERERERDRRRWEDNARRDRPSAASWGRD
ncbi:hypothetical protein FOMPIDRAFT_131485 [Fomitopsis schrenkii]|uniref:Multiple myeloma tumor-associated protein 2-like N-terminal domain-containing protein n=1 Tax=Fomitopsis schrenkii TaxID=2126942 RepID=S8F643_FOMSC|nr:hypothetical protein FOMPIDRAFT_131485 [Fomitopsis schrenkii]